MAQNTTTKAKAEKHDTLLPLLTAMTKEFQDAARKKPDGVLNANKVRIVNRLLAEVFTILEDEQSRPFLDLLSDEDLPQNSDVALILGQALAAMNAFKARYYGYDRNRHEDAWFL